MKRAQRQASASSSAITKSLGGIKAGIAGLVSALSIGLLTTVIKNSLDFAGSLGEVSQQLGVSTRDLQNFRAVAGQVGVSQEELEKGLGKLTITLGQVAAGAKAPTKALEAIGISAKDLAGLDTGAAFRKIADGLAKVSDRSQRAAVEVALFGRAGAKLDTMLSGGSAAINELARANEELGGVLSDEQIQNADKTADKLAQLQMVLKTQIAGAVANNADAILGLANALVTLINTLSAAGAAWARYTATVAINMNELKKLNPFADRKALDEASARERGKGGLAGKSVTVTLKPARAYKPPAPVGGANIGQFLAGGGGGGGKKRAGGGGGKDRSAEQAERKRLDSIRDAYRFDEDTRRADMDILRAKQSLATDYVERYALSIQMLDLEKASYEASLQNDVAMGEMTQAQAAILRAKYAIKDGLEREAALVEEEENRQRDYEMLEQKSFEIRQGLLEKQAGLAETSSERRAVELEILKLAYEEKRRALQHIIDTSKDWAEQDAARRDLAALGANRTADEQGVMNSTRGPMEEYLKGVPDTAAKMEEALQSVKVNAIDGIVQGLTDAAMGAQNLADVFKNVAKQIIADLIKIAIQKAITGALGKAFDSFAGGFGGILKGGMSASKAGGALKAQGFARGGSFTVLGKSGVDRNTLSMNGLPIARVSYGERISVSNDNNGGASVRPYFDLRGAVMTADLVAQMNQIGQVSTQRGALLGASGGQQATTRQARRQIP